MKREEIGRLATRRLRAGGWARSPWLRSTGCLQLLSVAAINEAKRFISPAAGATISVDLSGSRTAREASSPAFLVVAAAGKSACGKRPKRRRIPSRAHPFVNEHPTNFTVTRSGICVACTHSPIHENARQHAGTSAGPEKRGQENPPRTDKTSTKFSERECD